MKNTSHIFSVRVCSRWVLCPTRPKMLEVRAQVVYLWDRNPAQELDWDTRALVLLLIPFFVVTALKVPSFLCNDFRRRLPSGRSQTSSSIISSSGSSKGIYDSSDVDPLHLKALYFTFVCILILGKVRFMINIYKMFDVLLWMNLFPLHQAFRSSFMVWRPLFLLQDQRVLEWSSLQSLIRYLHDPK